MVLAKICVVLDVIDYFTKQMSKSKVRQYLMRYWFYGGMTGNGGHGIVFYIWHRVI
jgi:hypothetical protein